MIRACLAAAAAVVLLAGCSEDSPPAAAPSAAVPSAVAPSRAAPVPSVSVVVPRGRGYAQPCQELTRIAGDWVELAVRAGESQDLKVDVTRQEVEAMINRLAAVQPGLPPDVYPLVPALVEPMVQLRGVLMTGVTSSIAFGPGRDNLPLVSERCAAHLPSGGPGR